MLWLSRIALAAGLLGAAAGCKTDDDLAERPWNAPKSWETGLPSGINEGR